MKNRWRGAPVALMVAAGAAMGPAALAMRQSTLPTGSVLQVRLDNAIGSDRSQRGDRFTATVNGNSGYGLPSGTRVEGVVTDVQRASNDRPGHAGRRFPPDPPAGR